MSRLLFKMAKPFLHRMDPETAHGMTLRALKASVLPCPARIPDARLKSVLWNRTFPNPLGLAAGFDKNAEVIGAMLKIGFGFVEAGTVTPRSQEGNPRPRVFRDADHEAVINRMGFPNGGMENFRHNIEKFLEEKPRPAGIVGINIGMNKGVEDPAKDYCTLVRAFGNYADYLTVNISSPNTPGLRNLQARENLMPLLARILDERTKACGKTHAPPLLVKLAPDLNDDQLKDVAACLTEAGIDGVILGNTTLDRPDYLPADFYEQQGGLSGRPLTDKSTHIIRQFYKLTEGKMTIIGAGGISSAQDAYAKIRAGASLVQLYTALVFQGPSLVSDILTGLGRLLEKDGFDHITKAIGKDA
ncbi:MAG: quinone-dependent dihydroorotate dehydrogenase [Micavibrio aeruginosavorus]|uniref:Dihydroorotate dehydrogenase (quinone) n=1 Tax=Micavibrio aeruginosavorus TaxID=349221 RepID=A0A2W5PRR1_9BACT|nr:MAG: quinone-dependent dihydroorotate dehydrogenase [Micavibrio aeruginosavorus]